MSNDYQKANGAKSAANAMARFGKRQARKMARRLGKMALKKVGLGILIKTAPIWGAVLLIMILVLSMFSLFMPDVSQTKASEYNTNAMELGIPPATLLAFDTALYENDDMENRNPNDSAYYFIRVVYEKFKPATRVCSKRGGDRTCTEWTDVPEKVTEHSEYQGKEDIQKFFERFNQPLDNIPEALNNIRERDNTRLMMTSLSVEVAMEQAGFTEEMKEHFYEILEVGFIHEEFPDMGFGLGFGAYCSPTKEVDEGAWSNAFASAGVFKGYESTFQSIAKKQGIDPVIMAAIAFHETGFGTSNAVRTKNNPGGLMNPNGSGLFVFSTLESGLESMGRTLHNRIVKDGKSTIEALGSVYAPVGAANDPTGLNSHWVPNITKIVQNLGGLTMNCEANTYLPIGIDGATSETAQTISAAGFKYIGNSRYVFGGGRNQGDIARGWFDCSSFVHYAYNQAGLELGPLHSVSTETLNKTGRKVSINELQVGDLIFFDTYKRDGHVGIYIGNGKWIGSQSSTGVAIVDVNDSYWMSVFKGHVRRILP